MIRNAKWKIFSVQNWTTAEFEPQKWTENECQKQVSKNKRQIKLKSGQKSTGWAFGQFLASADKKTDIFKWKTF